MTSLVDVSQADSDAAAKVAMDIYCANSDVLCGADVDEMDDLLAQAFARHRLTAEQAKDAEIERAIASTTDLEKRVAVLEEALIKISRAVRSNRLVSHKLTKIDETCRATLNDSHSEERTR